MNPGTLNKIRTEIKEVSSSAKNFFISNSHLVSKDHFIKRGSLIGLDDKKGAIYVYFKNKIPLYVGETGGGVRERTHFETSKHTETDWWDHWTELRFLSVRNRTDRLLLEILLILAYKPKYNRKPEARDFKDLFTA